MVEETENKYNKMQGIASDLRELCKKHGVAIIINGDPSKSDKKFSELIDGHTLFNLRVLDCDKSDIDQKLTHVANKLRFDRQMAFDKALGQKIYASSIVIKLNKKRG